MGRLKERLEYMMGEPITLPHLLVAALVPALLIFIVVTLSMVAN